MMTVILLLRPESFGVLLSCANQVFCYKPLWDYKFKYERKTKRIVVVVVKRRHLANGQTTQVYVATFTEHYSQKKILRTVYCETDSINLSNLIKILAEKV